MDKTELRKAREYFEELFIVALSMVEERYGDVAKTAYFGILENHMRSLFMESLRKNPKDEIINIMYQQACTIKNEIEKERPDLRRRSQRF